MGPKRKESMRADRTRAHGENVADDAAHAGGRALERLDGAGMIVRLDFEGDGQPVADVNDAGVFLARADEDAGRLGGEGLEERAGVFVGAMLAPHDGENAQFGVTRFASEEGFDLLVLLGSEIVLLTNSGVILGSLMPVVLGESRRYLRHMLILIFLDENTQHFHHGGEWMVFIFSHFVDQPVQ